MNLEALHAILDERPDDWETRLVLADLMEEMGDDVGANGQRWQVEYKKRPQHPPSTSRSFDWWDWWDAIDDKGEFSLGRDIMTPHDSTDKAFARLYQGHATRQEAERALAERLAELRISAYCHK